MAPAAGHVVDDPVRRPVAVGRDRVKSHIVFAPLLGFGGGQRHVYGGIILTVEIEGHPVWQRAQHFAGFQIDGDIFPRRVQPSAVGEMDGKGLRTVKIGGIKEESGTHGREAVSVTLVLPSGLVLQIKVQGLEFGGVVRVFLHDEPGLGGPALHGKAQALAVYFYPTGFPFGAVIVEDRGVQRHGKDELRQCVPIARIGRGARTVVALHLADNADGVGEEEIIGRRIGGDALFQTAAGEVAGERGEGQVLTIDGLEVSIDVVGVIGAVDLHQEGELGVVQDEIGEIQSDAVHRLGLADILGIIVFNGGFQAGGEGHRLQEGQKGGHVGAGQRHGNGEVDQQHEGGKDTGQTGGGDAQKAPELPAAASGFGPSEGIFQGGRSLFQLGTKGAVFVHTVHVHTSSWSSSARRSRERALRCRVDTVPAGMERASAVSAMV